MSTRYNPLTLSPSATDEAITLPSLLSASDRLAEEAREVLPYNFDVCTWDKGYLRQAVWSCLDCGQKGVCYACSISCHSDHRLVELFPRRHFRCDCPTSYSASQTSGPSASSSFPSAASSSKPGPSCYAPRCTLVSRQQQPAPLNAENRYGPNFKGWFCRCERGKVYDPEKETEGMLSCIGCEDWFHESCLNLRAAPAQAATAPDEPTKAGGLDEHRGGEEDDDDDDDDEKDVLIPSSSYDCLICAACVRSNAALRDRAGKIEGWMMIEPKGEGGEAWQVIARRSGGMKDHEERATVEGEVAGSIEAGEAGGHTNKRSAMLAEEDNSEGDRDAKRVKVEENTPGEVRQAGKAEESWPWQGAGDVFLAYGEREKLKSSLTEAQIKSLPFPLEDEEIYEPPKDDDKEETLEEVTARAVEQLPRVQAIEALHGYQNMKDRLTAMLAGHARDGKVVSREDIEVLFDELRAGRAA